MLLSSGYREGTSHLRVYDLFEGIRAGEGQKDLLLPFSQISSVHNIQYAKVPYFGVACPKPHHDIVLEFHYISNSTGTHQLISEARK